MKHAIWRLMENELRYHQNPLLVCYGLFLMAVLTLGPGSHSPPYGLMPEEKLTFFLWLAVIGHQFLTYKFIATQRAENRLRFLLALPVSRHEIGQARLNTVILWLRSMATTASKAP